MLGNIPVVRLPRVKTLVMFQWYGTVMQFTDSHQCHLAYTHIFKVQAKVFVVLEVLRNVIRK